MSETVILCEGYHDRAFWAGWLAHLGCTDPGAPSGGKATRSPIYDPWNRLVASGHYAYHSATGRFIRVVPCHGRSEIVPASQRRLKQVALKPLVRLVLNMDPDVMVTSTSSSTRGLRHQDVLQLAKTFDAGATLRADGDIEMPGGAARLSLVRWETNDPPTPGVPDQQTLERVVCSALAAAFPARAKAVQHWLNTRPESPASDPKEHAWSYMAGWYADHGCEDFFIHLWRDAQVVCELESRLRVSGAWRIAEAVAQ